MLQFLLATMTWKGRKIKVNNKIYQMDLKKVYDLLLNKALRKGRHKEEVDELICWLTGYRKDTLSACLEQSLTYADFFQHAPAFNYSCAKNIKGRICGIKIEEIEEEMMWKIRCLDKLIDELAKGKSVSTIIHQYEGEE